MSNSLRLILLVSIATNLFAEEVFIDSIKSAEGVVLECSLAKKSELILNIMGENGKSVISATQQGKYLYITDKASFYAQPIYENSNDILHILEIERKIYFFNGQPLRGMLSDNELAESEEVYNILRQALTEAHSKGKCSHWKL